MLNFQEEISKMKPSLDVDEIEETISGIDLTDMNDIAMRLLLDMTNPVVQRGKLFRPESNEH